MEKIMDLKMKWQTGVDDILSELESEKKNPNAVQLKNISRTRKQLNLNL